MESSTPDDVTVFVATEEAVEAFGDVGAAAAAAAGRACRTSGDRVGVHAGRGPRAERRAQRLREVANPGQVVVSAFVASLLAEAAAPAAGWAVRDAGIHRLRDLAPPERLFELRAVDDPAEPSPLRSVDAHPNNLPVQLTSFVGRAAESAAVASLLARERSVTIAGPGGGGKTRLAAHVAAATIERWPEGAWWVDLQAVTDPSAVPARVADAAGVLVDPVGGPQRSLVRHLRDRRTLLCLDNCEHVLEPVADLVEALLASCPEVSVLATSRQPLGAAGEAIWRLPALRDADAIELFVERAEQVRPSFEADGGDRAVLRRLCRRLDGVPLAIELAAAWTRTLSAEQIEAGLDDRFSLLVNGARRSATRHRSLEASIDWSHDLLDPGPRAVLRRLAAFPGDFDLDAARAVCGDGGGDLGPAGVLPVLDGLVDRSLVVAEDRGGGRRFRLLETIRRYAARRLDEAGETAAVHDRHLDHFLAVAEGAEPLLEQDKDAWRALVEPERDNVRAALEWGLAADDPERGRRLAAATAWLWNLEGRGPEGLAVLRRAMAREPTARSPLQARLMFGYALVGDTAAPGDLDPVRQGGEIAAELGDDRLHGRFLSLAAVGAFANDTRLDAAWRLCEEALRLADAAGDAYGRDLALPLQGLILHMRDRHQEAEALLGPVTDRLIGRGDRGIASTVLVFRSKSALATGDVAGAQRLAERAAAVAEPLADHHRVGMVRSQLSLLRGVRGDLDGGLEFLDGFLRVVAGAGPGVVVPGMARTLGLLHLWRGDAGESVRWLLAPGPSPLPADPPDSADPPPAGPADPPALRDRPAGPPPAPDGPSDPLALPAAAEAFRHLGRPADAAAVLDRAEAFARRAGLPGVLADALDERAHLEGPDDVADALDLHHQALRLRVDHGLRTAQVTSLEALATRLAGTRRAATAARVLAAAASARAGIGVPRRPLDEDVHRATVAALRTALGEDRFAAAWRQGSALTLDDAVGLARRTRGRRSRPTTGWASLTPTELQVVTLVVDGLSNPEIAAKLVMRRSTVKSHLSHVFAKLEVANRIELAAVAARRLRHPS